MPCVYSVDFLNMVSPHGKGSMAESWHTPLFENKKLRQQWKYRLYRSLCRNQWRREKFQKGKTLV